MLNVNNNLKMLNTLDDYLLTNLFSQNPESLRHLYCTCKHAKKIIDSHIILHHLKNCCDYELLCEDAIKRNHFDCFMYYVNNNLLPSSSKYIHLLICTAISNNVQYFKYLHSHTILVKYWVENYHCDHDSTLNFNGNTDMCEYVLENNLMSPVFLLINFSAGGDLKCLQYMCSIDSPIVQRLTRNDSGLLDNAIYYKHYDCVKFLHEQGLEIHGWVFAWHSWFTNFKCMLYCSTHNRRMALGESIYLTATIIVPLYALCSGIYALCNH